MQEMYKAKQYSFISLPDVTGYYKTNKGENV
jgi:hypothetical protein